MHKTFNRNKADWPIFLGLAVVVFFFVASGFVAYSNILILKKDAAMVARTHEIITSLDNILSLVKDAETGQRGYLLSGREEYLEPYHAARRQIDVQTDDILQLTEGDQEQQKRVPVMKGMIDAKFEELAETIRIRKEQGLEQALAVVVTNRGKALMDDLRTELSDMRQTEHDLRQKRMEEMDRSYREAIMAGVISALLGIVLSVAIAALLRRAAVLRRREEWLQAGQVGLSKAMLGDLGVEQLGKNVLKFLAEYFGAHAGVFFAKDAAHYKRAATYGLPADSSTPVVFHADDGLLGQAASDARAFIVRDVPDGYLTIGSGLGQGNPRHLIIAPAMADGLTNAVLELGFVHPLDNHVIDLLEQVSNAIGIAVQSANYRENLQKLLEETQTQSEELQTQSEELRVSNEELEEQSHTLQESQSRLEQQQEELQVSNEEMEEKARALEEQNAQIRQQSRELKESQRLLEDKAKELELSSKYKSEFLANMSHELRTPLNSLLILARSLASNEEGNLTEEQIEEAQIIHNGGLELLSLINDILDLSKVEAGKLSIITEDIPVNGIVKRLEQQFGPIAKEAGVPFRINIVGGLPDTICTDAQRVEQILKNLLSNAFKFTETGSVTLEVSLPGTEVNLQRPSLEHGSTIAFSVTDTGIGIEQSKLNDIFEAFQQEDGSTDRHYGGTGLGLTIARKFAHMLGGEIQVASQKGQGSTFTLMLPTAWEVSGTNDDAQEATQLRAAPEPAKGELKAMPRGEMRAFIPDDRDMIDEKDKVLLIIEDDRDFAHTLMKMARKRGYKCLAAGDGKTGLLLASERLVHAILLDLKLPDIDGLNVLDQLKHDLRTRHIPVHIITGRVEMDNVVFLRKGAIGCLTKPVNTDDIDGAFTKIEGLLQSEIKKILVVEDDRNTQAAIQNLLKKKDIEIACVGMGATALERMEDEDFDCIILDLQLPDMTGFEWLEQVEKQAGESDPPPVIIYTARDLSEDENRKLNRYTGSIVIKGASSSERLLDEVTLFLHSVEATLTKDQQAMIRMQHDPDRVLQGRTALLVDDDMRNTFALSKLLKKHGMNVIIADNGQMALDKLSQEKGIELVIMDIMMPVMDGYQAMREIRAKKETWGLPIIALTARAMPEEQERCIEAGANDYMMKPVDVDRLLTLMRVWLFRQEAVA